MIEQISVYTENKKGVMRALLEKISQAEINVLGFVNHASVEFGTVRIIVSDTEKAISILNENGYLCRKSSVIGVELEDRPGKMQELLEIVEKMNINIEYMYVGYNRETSTPIILINCEQLDIVGDVLANKGYRIY